jgi:hypothetical protein
LEDIPQNRHQQSHDNAQIAYGERAAQDRRHLIHLPLVLSPLGLSHGEKLHEDLMDGPGVRRQWWAGQKVEGDIAYGPASDK